MQEYNSSLPPIKLPEYGRNVQNLVEYCKTIEDRTRRNRYARRIVDIMADIYPEARQMENCKAILWNHLAIIADFSLDIDYPYEIIPKTSFESKPNRIEYSKNDIRYRMYGKRVEDLLAKAAEINDPNQRIRLFELCANHIKRCYHQTYKDAKEDDDKIIQDMLDYTDGKYKDEIYKVFLYTSKDLMVNNQYDPATLVPAKKKKKKKKK